MLDENWFVPGVMPDFAEEELSLDFDMSQDPEAVWEWNGDSWAPVDCVTVVPFAPSTSERNVRWPLYRWRAN